MLRMPKTITYKCRYYNVANALGSADTVERLEDTDVLLTILAIQRRMNAMK